MNRVAVHHSVLDPDDPVACVLAARAGGVAAVGLHVTTDDGDGGLWDRGAGSPLFAALVEVLLVSRVTALDVGRVDLARGLGHGADDPGHRVLDLGSRLGAQFVTTRAADGVDTTAALAALGTRAAPFRVRPLLVPVVDTPVATPRQALAAVAGTRAGIVLDVVPSLADPDETAQLIVEAGDALGYVRVPADELRADMGAATCLLATLPPWVPVAIGAPQGPRTRRTADDPALVAARDGAFLAACRVAVDRLLVHPRALAAEGR